MRLKVNKKRAPKDSYRDNFLFRIENSSTPKMETLINSPAATAKPLSQKGVWVRYASMAPTNTPLVRTGQREAKNRF